MKKISFIFILIQLILLNIFLFARGDDSGDNVNSLDLLRVPKRLLTIISVDLDRVPLEQALSVIAEKGKFKLNYNRSRIPVNKKVSVKMKYVSAARVLQEVLEDAGVELKIIKGSQFAVVPRKIKTVSRGTIKGKIGEHLIRRVIPGAFIQIVNTNFSTLSNEKGDFQIPGVPVGRYRILFSADGFKTVGRADVIVRPERVTYINVKMQEKRLELRETIDITAGYFHKSEKNPNSVFNLSAGEVRRAPGTMGDVSRMLKALPGITIITDDIAELIIRGGCPLENGFYIDNIEVPYINHLPDFGTTGGVYSAINPGIIRNVDFFTGGFSADYGGRLSSITDITLREGNRKAFDLQIDINTAMAGGVFESPIANGRGSLIVSARKSYLKFLQDRGFVDFKDRIADTFDSQVKLSFDINPRHTVYILDLYEQGSFNEYGDIYIRESRRFSQNTLGINLVSKWSETFFSNTSLSHSSVKRDDGETYDNYNAGGEKIWEMGDTAAFFNLRNSNVLTVNNRNRLEFGFQVKHESDRLEHDIFPHVNREGEAIGESKGNFNYFTTRYSLFFSYISKPVKKLTAAFGLRGDYSSARDVFHLSPRVSLTYQAGNNFSLNGGVGVFYQTVPMNYLAYNPQLKRLKDMKAIHYILGLEYFMGTGTRMTLEGYFKHYKNLPVNPENPRTLVIDRLMDRYHDNRYGPMGYYMPSALENGASGYSWGVELLVQKKLVNKFYGILSATYFRSRYTDLLGDVHDRMYDNRYVINLTAGYKPDRKWDFSVKWTLMGGAPYTPVDIAKSIERNVSVLDESRFHGSRYPAYSTLNLRFERWFQLWKSNLILYLDIWNILDRKNVTAYWWSARQGVVVTDYLQLRCVPLLGIRYEF